MRPLSGVKRKKTPKAEYAERKDTAAQIREDAAAYGLRRDVLGVREAKDQLSSLLQRAAGGEEIVITSDGVPTAMIVRYKPVIRGKPFKPNWALLNSMPMTPDSTPVIRAERDSGN
jgi:prevent-host-death family protein